MVDDSALAAAAKARLDDAATYLPGLRPQIAVGAAWGCYLTDEAANSYIDFGNPTMVLGHRYPPVVYAMQEHQAHYLYPGFPNMIATRYAVEYAKALSQKFPPDADGNPRQVLVLPGETAAWEVVKQLGSFHYRFGSALWDGGLRDSGEVQDVVHQTRAGGELVVATEEGTGFGRTGKMWGYEYYGIAPDVVVLGSEGGGGLPFAAVVAPRHLFDKAGVGLQDCDMAANPLVCAAALATLEGITDTILDNVVVMGMHLQEAVSSLHDQFPIILGAKGVGLVQRLHLAERTRSEQFRKDCLARGLILGPGLSVTPPLNITAQGIDKAIDVMADVLMEFGS